MPHYIVLYDIVINLKLQNGTLHILHGKQYIYAAPNNTCSISFCQPCTHMPTTDNGGLPTGKCKGENSYMAVVMLLYSYPSKYYIE